MLTPLSSRLLRALMSMITIYHLYTNDCICINSSTLWFAFKDMHDTFNWPSNRTTLKLFKQMPIDNGSSINRPMNINNIIAMYCIWVKRAVYDYSPWKCIPFPPLCFCRVCVVKSLVFYMFHVLLIVFCSVFVLSYVILPYVLK